MREAKQRLDQVRDVVRDLRAGFAAAFERSGVSQALERLRGVTAERDQLSAAKQDDVAGAMERLRQAQRGEVGPDNVRANVDTAAAEREQREQQKIEEAQQRQRDLEIQRQTKKEQALEKAKGIERGDYGRSI